MERTITWRSVKPTRNDHLGPLTAALAGLRAEGRSTPCAGADGALWLSEDAEEREEAAERCQGCPVLEACYRAGAAERWGVWGGRDRSGSKVRSKSTELDARAKGAATSSTKPAKRAAKAAAASSTKPLEGAAAAGPLAGLSTTGPESVGLAPSTRQAGTEAVLSGAEPVSAASCASCPVLVAAAASITSTESGELSAELSADPGELTGSILPPGGVGQSSELAAETGRLLDPKSSGIAASSVVSGEPLGRGHKSGHNDPRNRAKAARSRALAEVTT